ncbi:hypothetical protein PybrP1_008058 [[Pythium] brassicae (nom. inval.)]|nr:hypothetical protein PybrP1_008058 [[Pythium] brassicae (nom. inval.)]
MNKAQRRAQVPQSATSPSALSAHVWEWAAAALWEAAAAAGERRCAVPTADWVVLANDGGGVRWLTTNKHGAIARKKLPLRDGAFPAAEISERFVRLASRWAALSGARASGSAPYIGVLVLRDGTRQLLAPVELQEWLDKLEAAAKATGGAAQRDVVARVAGLQAYVPSSPQSPTPACVAATYSTQSHDSHSGRVDVAARDAYCESHLSTSERAPALPSRVRREAESAALALVDALQRAGGERVHSACFEFVLDCEQRLWLTHVARVELARPPEASADSAAEPPTLSGARQQSLPALFAGPAGGASSVKCRGEFCRTPPAELAGLFVASPTADNDDNNDSYDSYDSRRRATAALSDTGQRFRIGHNNVQLARAEIDFLRGRVELPGASPAALALRWQEVDSVLRTELGRAQPAQFYKQVPVCANCYRVYAELNHARDSGFRRAGDATPRGSNGGGSGVALVTSSRVASALSGATDAFDQLFLAELAKHDAPSVTSEDTAQQQPQQLQRTTVSSGSSPARPELEDHGARPPSSSSSRLERGPLPALQPSLATSKKKQKKTPPALLAVRASNNQLAGSRADEPEPSARARAAQLEQELAQSRAAVARLEAQRLEAEQRCVQTEAQCAARLQAKDEQARKQLLELELAHSLRLAQPSRREPEPAAGEIGKLIETIDALHAQLDAAAAQSAAALTQQAGLQQLEIRRLHARYQVEMETLRLGEHAAKEQVEAAAQQLLALQSEAQAATAQGRSAKAALEQLREHVLAPLEEKSRRLERQVAELSATAAGTAAGATGPPSTMAAGEPGAAALERHLRNKVAYLKAQLASELTCKEELGSHLAQVTGALEQLKTEKRQALLAQEDAFRRQAQRAEAANAQAQDAAAAQLAALQGKLAALQANAADLVQELALSKGREANARLAVDKLGEENARLARQAADLEAQVEALADERRDVSATSGGAGAGALAGSMSAKSASDETQRLQTDALLRRLDNERQYLKNLLVDEQTAAAAREQQVAALERENAQLVQRLERDSTEAAAALAAETASRRETERELQDAVAGSEVSRQLLARQLQDVQAKFARAREQALLARDELEKTRIEAQDARAQLAAAGDALATERAAAESASTRGSQALALVRHSLRAVEEEKAAQLRRLEDENARVVAQLARTQGELLVLGDTCVADAARLRRQHALAVLALALRACEAVTQARRQARALQRLAVHSARAQQREALEAAHAAASCALEERLRGEFMDQCDAVTQSLSDERLAAVRQLTARHDADRAELQACFEQEKAQLVDAAERAAREHVQHLEDAHARALAALDARRAQQVAALDAQLGTLRTERDAAADALAELQTRCEALSGQLDAQASDATRTLAARAAAWEHEAQAMRAEHEQQVAELAARADAAEQKHAAQTLALRDALARERAASEQQAVDDAVAQAAAQATALAATHQAQLAAVEAAHQRRVADEVEQVAARWQRELRDAQAAHTRALQSAAERAESSAQSRLDALQHELLERQGRAVVQCTAKWQRALEELQARLDVDTRAAYDSGLRDREAAWQQAAAQVKLQQKEELARAQQEAMRAIAAAEQRHALRFEAALAQRTRELADAHAGDVARVTVEVSEQAALAASAERDAQLQQLTAALQNEQAMALAALRDELELRQAQEREALVAAAAAEKTSLLAHGEAATQQALAEAESEWTRQLDAVAREKDAHAQRALDALRCELADDYAHDTEKLRATLAREAAAQLQELEVRLLAEQEEAIAQVQDDSERLLEKVERAMAQLTAQKDATEAELARLRGALEEAEDAHFDAGEQLKQQRQRAAFDLLALLLHARRRVDGDAQAHTARVQELQAQHDQLESDRARERATRSAELAQARAAWGHMQSKHEEMLRTLTSYKRDELVAHRSASSVLANEISIVSKQIDEVREMRGALEKEVEALQGEAQSVEASLRQLMVQSAAASAGLESGAGGAALNMAVVAKKRRLNEEFEALLEQIERKKAEVRTVEKTFSALQTRRDAKEQEMKAMERKLVEILVQQQKQLLAQLAAARELPVLREHPHRGAEIRSRSTD